MRKFTMFVLLATVGAPAMASAQEEGERRGRHQQSEQSDNNQRPAREERAQRPERAQQAERGPQNEQRQQMQVERQAQMQQVQVDRQAQVQQMQAARQAQVQQIQQQQAERQVERQRQGQLEQDGERGRGRGAGRRADDGQAGDEQMQQYREQMQQRRARLGGQQPQVDPSQGGLVGRQGRYRTVPNINPNVVGQPAPENREARLAHRDRRDGYDRNQWSSSNWRHDRRYDWRRYRDQHRSAFRLSFYFDPFGYSYNRFGIGSYMYAGYYQSNYWINDPWRYRLPQAYGPYRWVRYHNDALMIDTWSGEVVDVIYGFFW